MNLPYLAFVSVAVMLAAGVGCVGLRRVAYWLLLVRVVECCGVLLGVLLLKCAVCNAVI